MRLVPEKELKKEEIIPLVLTPPLQELELLEEEEQEIPEFLLAEESKVASQVGQIASQSVQKTVNITHKKYKEQSTEDKKNIWNNLPYNVPKANDLLFTSIDDNNYNISNDYLNLNYNIIQQEFICSYANSKISYTWQNVKTITNSSIFTPINIDPTLQQQITRNKVINFSYNHGHDKINILAINDGMEVLVNDYKRIVMVKQGPTMFFTINDASSPSYLPAATTFYHNIFSRNGYTLAHAQSSNNNMIMGNLTYNNAYLQRYTYDSITIPITQSVTMFLQTKYEDSYIMNGDIISYFPKHQYADSDGTIFTLQEQILCCKQLADSNMVDYYKFFLSDKPAIIRKYYPAIISEQSKWSASYYDSLVKFTDKKEFSPVVQRLSLDSIVEFNVKSWLCYVQVFSNVLLMDIDLHNFINPDNQTVAIELQNNKISNIVFQKHSYSYKVNNVPLAQVIARFKQLFTFLHIYK